MHLRIPFSGLLASLLLFAPPVQAQSQGETTVGLGVSINAPVVRTSQADGGGPSSLAPFTFTLPITSASFRLEPNVGFVRFSRSANDRTTTTSALTVGTGAFYLSKFEDTQLQIGGRIGLSRLSEVVENRNEEDSSSRTNFLIGPALGGEYYVGKHFSVGIEARFLYINVGEPDNAPEDFSASQLGTSGVAFLRAHF